ncbi:MAG: translation initiation factor IF-2 [bacterium]|uniref:Translation initiation factor IF-2 n=1 Tax=Candidatus Methylomirabilis tolerans TaxID=3123416 RepID=A0AAJ1EIL7_9BACT|nr:translation initiation factor IF-2 [Candidatus Methylomirabilis sp.]
MIRVYDLAKLLGMSSKELIDRLEQSGLQLKSHSSNVDEDQVRSLLTAAPPQKKSRPKSKPSETAPPVHAKSVEDRGPRAEKAEESATTTKASTRKPVQSKPPETKAPSKARPATAGTGSVEKLSSVAQKESPGSKAVSALQSSEGTAVLEQPSSVPIQSPREVLVAPAGLKAAPSKTQIPPPPISAPEQEEKGTIIPPTPQPQVPIEQVEREAPVPPRPIVKIAETMTVKELAEQISISPSEIIKQLIKMGIMTTINQPLDVEVVKRAADRLGFTVEVTPLEEAGAEAKESEDPLLLLPRPAVVTIMGHVDHGKTSLLDAIRQTNVIAMESGGITQHIGAYQVDLPGGKITFLDTPGHEAFTAMRARGAQATDIVVLVVAADDGVMPQTSEAISHAKDAGVPILVAVNKIDKPGADPNRVKQQLAEYGLVPEEWGGQTVYVEVSAKKQVGIEHLLEMLLLLAEVSELKANPHRAAKGVIIEAELDRGRGPVATVLVQQGTLKVGDVIVAGLHSGRVRAMNNEKGKRIHMAGPATPVEVLGLSGIPMAGDTFVVVSDERKGRQIALGRQQKHREETIVSKHRITLEDLHRRIAEGEVKELRIIIKGDVQGSIGPFRESLGRIGTGAVRLKVIHASVGAINETDVMLASASNAIIVGFHVRPDPKVQKLAEQEGVDIRLYTVIYDAINEIRQAMEGLLEPKYIERSIGRVEVRQVFQVPKMGAIAGSFVVEGKVYRDSQVCVVRDGKVVHKGRVGSLRRFKEDIREVQNGFECGIGLMNFNDIKVGDILEIFELESVAQKL